MNNVQSINSFRLVKSQPKNFENFQENFLLKVKENSPTQSSGFDSMPIMENNLHIDFSKIPLENPMKQSEVLPVSNRPIDSLKKESLNIELIGKINEYVNETKSSPFKNSNMTSVEEIFSPKRLKKAKNFADAADLINQEGIIYNNNLLEIHMKKENSTVIPFVKKFLNKLKNASSLRDLVQLKPKNFKLLSDSSYFYEEIFRKEEISQASGFHKFWLKIKDFYDFLSYKLIKSYYIKTFVNFIHGHQMVLHPYQNIKVLWDILHLILIILWFFYIPMLMAFEESNNIEFTVAFYSSIFFIIDIFLNFNTSYFKNGAVEKKRRRIYSNYLSHNFIYDLITLLPIVLDFILFNHYDYNSYHYFVYIKFLFFLKINTFKDIFNRILEKFMLKEKFQNILALFKVFFISILVAHIFACFWYFAAEESSSATTWLSEKNLLNSPWKIQYLYSMYWASITMMTVGYGDITPQNEVETIVCLISVVLGCAVYAYNINSIGMILQDLNKEDVEFNHNINIINQFMSRKNINQDLQMRIREYLRFIWKEENTQNIEEEHKIINSLSGSLKEELLIEAYGSVLKKYPMFFANFSEKTLRRVAGIIKDIKLFPDEKVFFEDEDDDYSIYFIMKGKIELFTNSGKVIKELGVGDVFGEIGFFSGKPRKLSSRSKNFTTLFAIKREEFMSLLQRNSDDFEKFCMIQDQLKLYDNYFPLKLRCFSCNQIGHLASNCQLLHYLPDKEKIVKTFNYYLDQERDTAFVRRKLRKNALNGKQSFQNASKKLKDKMQFEKEEMQNNFFGSENYSLSSYSENDYGSENDEPDDIEHKENKTESSPTHTTIIRSTHFHEGGNSPKNRSSKPQSRNSSPSHKNHEKHNDPLFVIDETENIKELIEVSNDSQGSLQDVSKSSSKNLDNFILNLKNGIVTNSMLSLDECKLHLGSNKDDKNSEVSLLRIPEAHIQRKQNPADFPIHYKKRYATEVVGRDFGPHKKTHGPIYDPEANEILFLENFKRKLTNPNSNPSGSDEMLLLRRNKRMLSEETEKKTMLLSNMKKNINMKDVNSRNSIISQKPPKSGSSIINVGNMNNQTYLIPNSHENIMDHFERVAHFKNYFPENNSKTIFEEMNSRKPPPQKYSRIIKERKKSLEKKLCKYTFFLEDMKLRMPNAIKKRAKIQLRSKREAIVDKLPTFKMNKSFRLEEKFTKKKQKDLFYGKKYFTGGLLNIEQKFSDIVKLIMKSPNLKKQIKKNAKKYNTTFKDPN